MNKRIFAAGFATGSVIGAAVYFLVDKIIKARKEKASESEEETPEPEPASKSKTHVYTGPTKSKTYQPDHEAHVIKSEEIGMNPTYKTVYMHYCTDGVIFAEDFTHKKYRRVDDFEQTLKIDILEHFGQDPDDPEIVAIDDPYALTYWVIMQDADDSNDFADRVGDVDEVRALTKELGYMTDDEA